MKIAKIKRGWKIKLGKGKVKRTVKIPILEAIIIGVGLVEGYLLGGLTGALFGIALGGIAILACMLCAIPFLGLLIYHWIMTYSFGIAHVHMTHLYLVGFICGIYITFKVIVEVTKTIEKRTKKKLQSNMN